MEFPLLAERSNLVVFKHTVRTGASTLRRATFNLGGASALLAVCCASFPQAVRAADSNSPEQKGVMPAEGLNDWDVASQRAETLLGKMTTEEKIGQLVLFTSSATVTGPSTERADLLEQIRKGRCGNVFNAVGVDQTRPLQKVAVEETRLKIPLLFGYDVIHG